MVQQHTCAVVNGAIVQVRDGLMWLQRGLPTSDLGANDVRACGHSRTNQTFSKPPSPSPARFSNY
jgi:hypothetical protein